MENVMVVKLELQQFLVVVIPHLSFWASFTNSSDARSSSGLRFSIAFCTSACAATSCGMDLDFSLMRLHFLRTRFSRLLEPIPCRQAAPRTGRHCECPRSFLWSLCS